VRLAAAIAADNSYADFVSCAGSSACRSRGSAEGETGSNNRASGNELAAGHGCVHAANEMESQRNWQEL
jgi:hypothetical protein